MQMKHDSTERMGDFPSTQLNPEFKGISTFLQIKNVCSSKRGCSVGFFLVWFGFVITKIHWDVASINWRSWTGCSPEVPSNPDFQVHATQTATFKYSHQGYCQHTSWWDSAALCHLTVTERQEEKNKGQVSIQNKGTVKVLRCSQRTGFAQRGSWLFLLIEIRNNSWLPVT